MRSQDWSRAIIARDKACRDCGAASPLHAHHIKPRSMFPALAYDMANGVALCPSCHWRRHEAERMPRSRAKKRGPNRKTLERQVAYLRGTPRAMERIDELEREVRALKQTIVKLRLRLATKRLTA